MPSDRITVMTFASQLNVLQDFTGDRDSILSALRTVMPNSAAGAVSTGIQFQAIQAAISALRTVPDKKAMIYFSSGIPRSGNDDQDQLRDITAAAARANISIYSVDSRGLVPSNRN
jgi:VWFA-related protein